MPFGPYVAMKCNTCMCFTAENFCWLKVVERANAAHKRPKSSFFSLQNVCLQLASELTATTTSDLTDLYQ